MSKFDAQRRQMLDASLLAGGLAATGGVIPIDAFAADKANVSLQLGWLIGGNQIGEVVAKRLGYYDQEGVNLTIQPGGPNIDGVAVVASGRNEVGQVSSSPSIMLATSQGIPVKCFAVGAQRHPYVGSASRPVRPRPFTRIAACRRRCGRSWRSTASSSGRKSAPWARRAAPPTWAP
ncbi:ABC transporter substrate-binding protein [Verminephrobacter eiseniae]|uniref:ABC transporter substrate-binding protein n=1 Tax=Verminephrobacter eiseniae TaxID=364317 RepID=UPI002238A9A0|nr:ABC transporter substrate-binding protein [Verminephrobacter eiseniae]